LVFAAVIFTSFPLPYPCPRPRYAPPPTPITSPHHCHTCLINAVNVSTAVLAWIAAALGILLVVLEASGVLDGVVLALPAAGTCALVTLALGIAVVGLREWAAVRRTRKNGGCPAKLTSIRPTGAARRGMVRRFCGFNPLPISPKGVAWGEVPRAEVLTESPMSEEAPLPTFRTRAVTEGGRRPSSAYRLDPITADVTAGDLITSRRLSEHARIELPPSASLEAPAPTSKHGSGTFGSVARSWFPRKTHASKRPPTSTTSTGRSSRREPGDTCDEDPEFARMSGASVHSWRGAPNPVTPTRSGESVQPGRYSTSGLSHPGNRSYNGRSRSIEAMSAKSQELAAGRSAQAFALGIGEPTESVEQLEEEEADMLRYLVDAEDDTEGAYTEPARDYLQVTMADLFSRQTPNRAPLLGLSIGGVSRRTLDKNPSSNIDAHNTSPTQEDELRFSIFRRARKPSAATASTDPSLATHPALLTPSSSQVSEGGPDVVEESTGGPRFQSKAGGPRYSSPLFPEARPAGPSAHAATDTSPPCLEEPTIDLGTSMSDVSREDRPRLSDISVGSEVKQQGPPRGGATQRRAGSDIREIVNMSRRSSIIGTRMMSDVIGVTDRQGSVVIGGAIGAEVLMNRRASRGGLLRPGGGEDDVGGKSAEALPVAGVSGQNIAAANAGLPGLSNDPAARYVAPGEEEANDSQRATRLSMRAPSISTERKPM
ncbi:hypothetical protein BDK51DRAFT_32557, partial [Blyttiomyces helicus]